MQQPTDTPPDVTPRASALRVAREGYRFIAAAATLTVVLFAFGWTVLGALMLALTIFLVAFFRDPERDVPDGAGLIVSPADGRVIKVTRVQDDRFLHSEVTLISIFMSPADVHINRAPISGRVVDVRYHPGKYFRAFADKASLDNEQNAVLMEDERGRRLCFVQIAGFIARRIVCYLSAGMETERGQRCGMIMLGSRADIYLPPATEVRVKVGDHVSGASTVIAQWT